MHYLGAHGFQNHTNAWVQILKWGLELCDLCKLHKLSLPQSLHPWNVTPMLSEYVKINQDKGFPGGLAGKKSACNLGDLGLIPGLGRSLEKGKATHSSILNWRIPWLKVKEESEKVGLKLNIQKTKIMASGPITSWEIDGETVETVSVFILGGSKITADGDCSHEIKRRLLLGRKVMTNLDSILKNRDITLPTKILVVKAVVFPYTWMYAHVRMWKLDCEESWAQKNWCFWIVLEKTLESPLDCKASQSILKEISPWVFIGRTDAEAETSILWPPHVKSRLIGKDSDAGRDWGQEKGTTEDEMAGWHHQLNGYAFE